MGNMTRDQLRALNPAAAQKLDEEDKRRALKVWGGPDVRTPPRAEVFHVEQSTPSTPRIRQARAKVMNKTETDFFLHIQNLTGNAGTIRFNAVRFELANGLHFKPDFTVGITTAYEAKGPWASRDAFPRLKMAARLYPEIKWYLATRAKRTGAWDIQHVLP